MKKLIFSKPVAKKDKNKDWLYTEIKITPTTKESYDGSNINRFVQDEFCLWGTGQSIKLKLPKL